MEVTSKEINTLVKEISRLLEYDDPAEKTLKKILIHLLKINICAVNERDEKIKELEHEIGQLQSLKENASIKF